ncbi:WhiB family transcriptional regulator [Streptacidiphilus monticola]|uniref:Transcriptional regulator WhiB n=1 Tax=Streptacidiphilus monticola TaxID=2161674 RepID=A0ABW1G1F2_9ACTN
MAARRHPRMLALRTPSSPARFHQALTVTAPPDSELPGALCRQVAPDVFFPEPDDAEGVALAKTVCGYCPAQNACLTAALKRDERIGVRGGTTPAERDALLGRQRRCGTPGGYTDHAAYGELPCDACRTAHTAANAARRAERAAQSSRRPPGPRIPPPSFGPYQRPGTEAA